MARPCGKFEIFFAATTLLFFVLAVITLAEPLVLLIAVVVFGTPIFFLLLFAPSVFVILLPLLIFYTITPTSKFGKFFIASVLTVLILGLPPLWLNAQLKAKAAAWTSQDHNQIELPLRGGVHRYQEAVQLRKTIDTVRRPLLARSTDRNCEEVSDFFFRATISAADGTRSGARVQPGAQRCLSSSPVRARLRHA
jgi:hypothetical protein